LILAHLEYAGEGIIDIGKGFGMYIINKHAILRQFADAMYIGTHDIYLVF